MLYYIYGNGGLVGLVYNNNSYYYHKNIFGDIIGILDSNYNEIVTYEYDSWGAILNIIDNSNINLGTINPFRYRSYYYDSETQLYYLNSRYYNPRIKRFINGDVYVSTGQGIIGNNMYQYCGNSPIINIDKNGNLIWFAIGVAVFSIAGGTGAVLAQRSYNKSVGNDINDGVFSAAVGGIVAGGFGFALLKYEAMGILVASIYGCCASGFVDVISGRMNAKDYAGNTMIGIIDNTTSGIVISAFANSIIPTPTGPMEETINNAKSFITTGPSSYYGQKISNYTNDVVSKTNKNTKSNQESSNMQWASDNYLPLEQQDKGRLLYHFWWSPYYIPPNKRVCLPL